MTLGKGASKNINVLVGCVLGLTLSGCSSANDYGVELPYDAWRLGFLAPNYMEVWIETANVVDVKGRLFRRAMSGVAAVQTPPNLNGTPRGWPRRPGSGAGKHVWRADVPRLIYVRWQSLVEPQTYEAYIEIPETTRHAMVKVEEHTYCKAAKTWITDHRELLVIGLAPGGIAKTWIKGTCLDPIEVSRVQGRIVENGPHEGHSHGLYYRPPNEASQAYIDKFGIPYDSW
jgi:hypothetical protein